MSDATGMKPHVAAPPPFDEAAEIERMFAWAVAEFRAGRRLAFVVHVDEGPSSTPFYRHGGYRDVTTFTKRNCRLFGDLSLSTGFAFMNDFGDLGQ